MSDAAFLQSIIENPDDDALLLVYADWLEDQGHPDAEARCEFLRLTVDHNRQPIIAAVQRLQQLASQLDTSWLAVVSRLAIENCHGKNAKGGSSHPDLPAFNFLCDLRWEDLQSTDAPTIRICDKCKHSVHYCDSISEARDHARSGHCVAVDIGVIRRENDLEEEEMLLGSLCFEDEDDEN